MNNIICLYPNEEYCKIFINQFNKNISYKPFISKWPYYVIYYEKTGEYIFRSDFFINELQMNDFILHNSKYSTYHIMKFDKFDNLNIDVYSEIKMKMELCTKELLNNIRKLTIEKDFI